jgi:hypothetical protein
MDREEILDIIESMELDDPDIFFDGWHTHADWDGNGNRDWLTRKKYLDDLVNFYNELKTRLTNYHKPYQLWIWIGEDAVFFNTPTPNADNFPVTIDNLDGLDFKNRELKDYISGLGFEIIQDKYEEQLQYYLFDKKTGVPLTRQ